jgi:hypothetical protein
MAHSESQYLLALWDRNICPFCGKDIPPNSRVGSGRKSEGGFCSLDCYTGYYGLELQERARKVAERAEQNPKKDDA